MPTTSDNTGLVRLVVAVMSLILHQALCMEENADVETDSYYVTDARSAASIVRALTENHAIRVTELNSPISFLQKLGKLRNLSSDELNDDRYAAAGIFDIAFHAGRAIIATSSSYAALKGTDVEPLRTPQGVYDRIVEGLGSAFDLTSEHVRDVLGPLHECSFDRLGTHTLFPRMEWMVRARMGDGASLWKNLYDTGCLLDDVICRRMSSSAPHSMVNRKQIPPAVQIDYEQDKNEGALDGCTDRDADGSTDPDYHPMEEQAQLVSPLRGPSQTYCAGNGKRRRSVSKSDPEEEFNVSRPLQQKRKRVAAERMDY